MGRGGGNKGKVISPGNLPKMEKVVEQKGWDIHNVRTLACMKAMGVAPLVSQASDQSLEKAIKILGAWSEIGADPWVMRIMQWGYRIPLVTLPPLTTQGQETTYPMGTPTWSSLNQSVHELRSKGAIKLAPHSHLFLVTKATGEWRPIIVLSSLNAFVHCPSFTMETGPVVNVPRLERCLISYRDQPSQQTLSTTFCHDGTAWQFTVLPFGLSTSLRVFTKILKPVHVLANAHLHQGKIAHVPRYNTHTSIVSPKNAVHWWPSVSLHPYKTNISFFWGQLSELTYLVASRDQIQWRTDGWTDRQMDGWMDTVITKY